jgi:hypothetical protein
VRRVRGVWAIARLSGRVSTCCCRCSGPQIIRLDRVNPVHAQRVLEVLRRQHQPLVLAALLLFRLAHLGLLQRIVRNIGNKLLCRERNNARSDRAAKEGVSEWATSRGAHALNWGDAQKNAHHSQDESHRARALTHEHLMNVPYESRSSLGNTL